MWHSFGCTYVYQVLMVQSLDYRDVHSILPGGVQLDCNKVDFAQGSAGASLHDDKVEVNKVDFARSSGGVSLHDDKVGVTEQG